MRPRLSSIYRGDGRHYRPTRLFYTYPYVKGIIVPGSKQEPSKKPDFCPKTLLFGRLRAKIPISNRPLMRFCSLIAVP